MVLCFEFCGRHVADRLKETAVVKPVDPVQRRVLDGVDCPPRSLRRVFGTVLQHQARSSLAHLGRPVLSTFHSSILSTFGASGKSGPIQAAAVVRRRPRSHSIRQRRGEPDRSHPDRNRVARRTRGGSAGPKLAHLAKPKLTHPIVQCRSRLTVLTRLRCLGGSLLCGVVALPHPEALALRRDDDRMVSQAV
jgi:hypothetical protein